MTASAVLDADAPNAFEDFKNLTWPHRYTVRVRFRDLVLGGTPTDEKVAKAWLATKLNTNDEALMARVKEVMMERSINADEAMKVVGDLKLLKGFRRDSTGLFLESRILKANLREAAAVAQSAGRVSNKREFGVTKSGVRSFFAEHVMVVENKLYLRDDTGGIVAKEHGIQQRFVHVFNGSSITYEEYLNQVWFEATIITDWDFGTDFWPILWLKGGELGLGATRSQGFGRYDVKLWEKQTTS